MMRPVDLLIAMGDIDERHIDERPIGQVRMKKRAPIWYKAVAVAACIALIVCAAYGGWYSHDVTGVTYPDTIVESVDPGTMDMWATILHFSYADLAQVADVIVVADVVDTFMIPPHNEPGERYWSTEYDMFATVSVREVLKGDVRKQDLLCVRQDGASYADEVSGEPMRVCSYSGGPLMDTHNRVLLFLFVREVEPAIEEDLLYCESVLSSVGAFFLERDGLYHAAQSYAAPSDHLRPMVFESDMVQSLSEIKRAMRREEKLLTEKDVEIIEYIQGLVYNNPFEE